MGLIDNIWSVIKGIVVNLIVTLFLLFSTKNVNKKKPFGLSKDGGSITTNNESEGVVLPEGLRQERMPRHVAMILDGNRRWAKERGLGFMEGYEAGVKAMQEFISMCCKLNIPVISLFILSTDNWSRPKMEIDFLSKLVEKRLKNKVFDFVLSLGGRVIMIGDRSRVPASFRKVIKDGEELTKDNTKCQLIVAISYTGQYDIVQACQSIATKVKNGLVEPEDVTNSLIEQELETKIIEFPNPDLLIRTSGELRISNYYLWQLAYTEMYFTHKYWPDFGEDDFYEALRSFQQRGRRAGTK